MSLSNRDSQGATLAGIVTIVALVLGLYLLIRVIRGARGVFRPDGRRQPRSRGWYIRAALNVLLVLVIAYLVLVVVGGFLIMATSG
jgi:ABC-type Fe3+ transport system permease subunit